VGNVARCLVTQVKRSHSRAAARRPQGVDLRDDSGEGRQGQKVPRDLARAHEPTGTRIVLGASSRGHVVGRRAGCTAYHARHLGRMPRRCTFCRCFGALARLGEHPRATPERA
jgi:hypothetical protein